MNKRKFKKIIKLTGLMVLFLGFAYLGATKINNVKAYGSTEYEGVYDFSKMHVRNIYQSEEKYVEELGVKTTQKTIELFVSKEYTSDYPCIFFYMEDYKTGKDAGFVTFSKDHEETITTNDGKPVEGYIFTANVWQNAGTVLKARVANYHSNGYLIDNNGGHGYELKF